MNIPEISIRQKSRTYDTAVEIAIEKKFYTMAVNLIKESKALNETEIKDQTYAHSVEIQLADIYNTQKNYEKAIDSIQKSVAITELMVDEKHRLTFNAISLLRYADTERFKENCEQAVNYYNQSIEIYHKISSPARYYEAKKNRLFCYLGQKDDETIEKEIADVIKLFESNRTKILEEQNRNTFADDEQNIYDLAVAFNFSKGNYEKAFNYSETSRSRSLLELQEKGAKLSTENNKNQIVFDEKATSNPLDLATIRSQISPQVQLIEYAVLSDKVVIWLITKDKFETYSFEIASDQLENKVADFLDAIKNKQSETQEKLSRELYQVLFSGVEKDLDKNKEIFVIPDKILFHLPFNALISTNTNNYLAIDYKIALSPSANVFLHCAENAKKRNLSEPEKLLSIGNPAFDQNEFPNLSQSLSAEKEARKIEKLYPKPTTTLIGKDATKEALKTNISAATVFHFAGHYVISEESPLLSSFLVAGEGENSKLTNFELFEQSLEKSKLIVLSACETGVEGYYKGEGMIGAGRTFLASGVPLVVASSWKVDFDATGELMLKFHQYRKNDGLDSVSALQKAQIEMINNQDKDFSQPFYWAGFSVIGGYAEF